MLDLTMPITGLRSVGVRSAARLSKLGIGTLRQLLWHLPSRYEDFTQSLPIAGVQPGSVVSIQGRVRTITTRSIWPRKMHVTTAVIEDDSGAIRAVWFNQPYLQESLAEGTSLSVSGKAVLDKRGLHLNAPLYEKIGNPGDALAATLRHTGRLVPVYPETAGVTSKFLRYLIQPVLESLQLPDPLSEVMRKRYGLIPLTQALQTIHYPSSLDDVAAARSRLAFDDLLLLQLKALSERRLTNLKKSPAISMDVSLVKKLMANLPFELTRDQRVALLEILKDMERNFPMNRLLEGDVGSGKTVVAVLAALHAAAAGWQTVLLAPTEVLAQQHYKTVRAMAKTTSTATTLLTGSSAYIGDAVAAKNIIKKGMADGSIKIIVGTHALLEEDVRTARLALAVIDEQHRFGISQRAGLVKNTNNSPAPHLLSMTATPIPRTLALTVFGDLDTSIIREKPKGRQAVVTKIVNAGQRAEMYEFIREQLHSGRQVFVICPLIEIQKPAETVSKKQLQTRLIWAQARAVEEEARKLSTTVFPEFKVAMLHGRMKAKDKNRVMQEFKDGWQDVLVSTSVVEVGVDVPNAVVMLIEGADRFGLAQLHQFRGRVGRGAEQSYCFLCATDDSIEYKRLQALVELDDGFALAEADMKLRGPGEFFGLKQSGVSDLTLAALADPELVKKARLVARVIMKNDPTLTSFPDLKKQLKEFGRLMHSE